MNRRDFLRGATTATAGLAAVAFPNAAEAGSLPSTVSPEQMAWIGRLEANNWPGENTGLLTSYGMPLQGTWTASNGVLVLYSQNGRRSSNPCDVVAIPDDGCVNANVSRRQQLAATQEFANYVTQLSGGTIRYVAQYSQENRCVSSPASNNYSDTGRGDGPSTPQGGGGSSTPQGGGGPSTPQGGGNSSGGGVVGGQAVPSAPTTTLGN